MPAWTSGPEEYNFLYGPPAPSIAPSNWVEPEHHRGSGTRATVLPEPYLSTGGGWWGCRYTLPQGHRHRFFFWGVTTPTWTSPGIWPTKEELKGEPPLWEDLLLPMCRDNYSSAKDFSSQVRQTFVEEVDMGMVEGPLTQEEAALRCGCTPAELCPGPLAAIDEGDKIRTIYDGSWGHANSHIQQNTVEKTTAPTSMDCVQAIHWLNTTREKSTGAVASGTDLGWHPLCKQTTWAILKADVSKAHRRIKVQSNEWRYQVAQLDGERWINKVGTYGMASAQPYWGRMAAVLLRLCYMRFPQIDWGFVFVDDFGWLLRTDTATEDTSKLLLFLAALGCPLSSHKTVLSEVSTWLGYVGISGQPLWTGGGFPQGTSLVVLGLRI